MREVSRDGVLVLRYGPGRTPSACLAVRTVARRSPWLGELAADDLVAALEHLYIATEAYLQDAPGVWDKARHRAYCWRVARAVRLRYLRAARRKRPEHPYTFVGCPEPDSDGLTELFFTSAHLFPEKDSALPARVRLTVRGGRRWLRAKNKLKVVDKEKGQIDHHLVFVKAYWATRSLQGLLMHWNPGRRAVQVRLS